MSAIGALPSRPLQVAGRDYSKRLVIPIEMEENINSSIEYRKPILVELGNVNKLMQGTIVKGPTGVLETVIGISFPPMIWMSDFQQYGLN